MAKIFIDGKEGTTGLRIYERLANRSDIELLLLSDDMRKDINMRAKMINESDITFLCLPDQAALEALTLVTNPNVRIIDTSTANRTNPDFAYGFSELGDEFYYNIKNSKRISNPGCHATGFISIVYPLIKLGIIDASYPLTATSLTGYSGGGKGMIKSYNENDRSILLDSPRIYGLTQNHKHLKEMVGVCGLLTKPIFNPIVSDYYNGMIVTVGLHKKFLKENFTKEEIHQKLSDFYNNKEGVVKIMPLGSEEALEGFIASNSYSDKDNLDIYVLGNDDNINIYACFDNLGKGASGSAIEAMNILLGCPITTGLNI